MSMHRVVRADILKIDFNVLKMKDLGYFFKNFLHFFSEFFGDKGLGKSGVHSNVRVCLKPSNATLKRLLELKHRQIYKTKRLSH